MTKSISFIQKHCTQKRFPVHIELLDKNAHLTVTRVLERIGNIVGDAIVNGEHVTQFTPVAHILHTHGKMYIGHYKHMYISKGATYWSDVSHINYCQLIQTVEMLRDWGLIKVVGDLPKRRSTYPLRVLTIDEICSGDYYLKPAYTKIKKQQEVTNND